MHKSILYRPDALAWSSLYED